MQPLAIRYHNPSDFIASVVEHHRGTRCPLPNTDAEKTFLVFVGVQDENDLCELMDKAQLRRLNEGEEEGQGQDEEEDSQRLPGESYRHEEYVGEVQSQTPGIDSPERDILQEDEEVFDSQQDLDNTRIPEQELQNPNARGVPMPEEPKTPRQSSPKNAEAAPIPLEPPSSPLSSPPPESSDDEFTLSAAASQWVQTQNLAKSQSTTGGPGPASCGDIGDSTATRESSTALQTPTSGKVLLPIREPSSPIPPQSYEISPLTPEQPYPTSSPPPPPSATPHLNDQYEEEGASFPTPTLDIISAAAHIELLYVHDLRTLRAFLTLLPLSPSLCHRGPLPPVSPPPGPEPETEPSRPLLAIWGLIASHHNTTQFSGQGIAHSIALAVDAAADSGRFLVLGEGYVPLTEDELGEGSREVNWLNADVPVLNGGSMIVGRTVLVKEVVGRWCRFVEDLE